MKTNLLLITGLAATLALGGLAIHAQELPPPDPATPETTDTNGLPPSGPDDGTPQPGDGSAAAAPTNSLSAASTAPATNSTVAPMRDDTLPPAPPARPFVPMRRISAGTNFVAGKGMLFNFRDVPLETVLNYMSDAAGYIIHPKVGISGKVTAWSAQPLTKAEALKLLQQVLAENGYTALEDGRTLTIIRSGDAAKSNIPVVSGNNPGNISKNDTIVTQIIPIRTLNAVQLLKDLDPLKPSSAIMTSDESANSIVMTDTQANIRHMTEIISALDSVTSSSTSIASFTLRYADAKSLASLIKDLFPGASSTTGNANNGGGRFRGFGGGGFNPFGGGGGGDAASEGNGKTPQLKVNAVADDHSNTLIVTAPDELLGTLSNLVASVDQPVEDQTVVKVFHLNNADAGEMADLLTSLFPDDSGTSSADATRSFRFGGGPFGFGGASTSTKDTSERAKKLSKVIAVADRRTSSLVVTTGKDLMEQITPMVAELDQSRAHKMSLHIMPLVSADPVDVQQILQDLIPSSSSGSSRGGSSSSSSSSQNNYLLNRAQTQLQQQNSTTTTTSFGSGSGSGSRSN